MGKIIFKNQNRMGRINLIKFKANYIVTEIKYM